MSRRQPAHARWVEVSGNNCKICQSLKISWQTDWRRPDSQHGFVLFSHSRLGHSTAESEIFLIYPATSQAQIWRYLPSHLQHGTAAFYPSEAGSGKRHLKEFLITVLLVRSSGEQYPDNATNELRDIFHFDETKEEYFGTNIQNSFSPEPRAH